MAKFENNLSKGNVVRQLIVFSIPFLLSNLIQSIYSVADMIIVGKFTKSVPGALVEAGTAAMSGVNIGSQVTFLITNAVFGLSVGATVLIGQYLGANNKKALKETIGTLFTTLLMLAAVITTVMLVLQEPLLRLIQTPEESFSEARSYFFITMLGTVFIFAYNALSAVMRGMGDSKNPLIFVAIACVTNIALDFLFVAGFQMGAAGAAVATVIAQAISVILCIIYLKKNDFIFDFKLKSFGFHFERLSLLLKIGIPTMVQNVATSFSFLFLTALVNTLGSTEAESVVFSAAVGAVGKFNGFAILPAIAMSSSISAMSAHNIGAGEFKRAVKTMTVGMSASALISVAIFALAQTMPEVFLKAFGDDVNMIAAGSEYIRSFSFDYLIVPFVFCFNGLFIGSGHTTFSLINGVLSSILIRVPMAFVFGKLLGLGLSGLGVAAPLASSVSLILGIWFFCSGKWKKMIIIKNA